jgi:dienelactone hydrolase
MRWGACAGGISPPWGVCRGDVDASSDLYADRMGATILLLPGGQVSSARPTSPWQAAVVRMVPLARALRASLPAPEYRVRLTRYAVRGWNGEQAAPVGDVLAYLDETARRFPGEPVVLVGHSMGGRAAFRAAGHPLVAAVAGLAPWLPPGEPVDQVAGRHVLLAHGAVDRVTSPAETWAFAARARVLADVARLTVRGGDHAMLRRARLWHRLVAEFSRDVLSLPADDQQLREEIRASRAAGGPSVV